MKERDQLSNLPFTRYALNSSFFSSSEKWCSVEKKTTPIEECPNKEVEEIEEKVDEENNIKDHEVSSPEVVSSHLNDRPERNDITKKSFSEKIIHYLSSKMNQINPDPIHQLEVLQSSGDVVNLPKTNTVDHV